MDRKRCGSCLSHLERGKSRRKRVAEELKVPPPCDLHLLIEEEEEEGGTLAALDSLEKLEEDDQDDDQQMETEKADRPKFVSETISATFLSQTLQKQDEPQHHIPESLSPTPTLLQSILKEPPLKPLGGSTTSPTPTLLPQISLHPKGTVEKTPSDARFQSIGLSPCLSLDNSLSLGATEVTHADLSLSPPMTLQEDDELPPPSRKAAPKPPTTPRPLPALSSPLEPSLEPSIDATLEPSIDDKLEPSIDVTLEPSIDATLEPSIDATLEPSIEPTLKPVVGPVIDPTLEPTFELTEPTMDMTLPIDPLPVPTPKSTPPPKSSPKPTSKPTPKSSPKPPPKSSPKKTPRKEFKEPQRRPSPQQDLTPSRKSRRIQPSSSFISLSSLISVGILSPRDELILFDHTGVLTADGWIEYNYDKYPTVEMWARAVVTRAKKKKLKLTNAELCAQIEVKVLNNSQNTLRTCFFSECVDIFRGQSTAPHPTPIPTLSRSIEELLPDNMDESYEEFNDSDTEEASPLRKREDTQGSEEIIEELEEIDEELEEFDEFDEFDEESSHGGSNVNEEGKEEMSEKMKEKQREEPIDKKKSEEVEKEEIENSLSFETPVNNDTILNTTPVRAKRRQKKGPLTPRRQHFRFTDMTQDNWEPYERQLKEVDFMLDELDSQSQSSQSSSLLSVAKLPSMNLDSSEGSVPSQLSMFDHSQVSGSSLLGGGDLWSPSRDEDDDMEED